MSNTTRREVLKTLGIAGAGLALPKWMWGADGGKRPNVVFLLTDDHQADALGALGNKVVKTPNIDKLAARGVTFRHAYCQGSNVAAVCIPSRKMIVTGMNLFHVKGPHPQSYATTFVRTMKAAGYATMNTGKEGNTAAGITAECDEHYVVQRSVNCAREHADNAIQFVRKHAGKQPFFAYVEFGTPHDPQPAPDEYYAQYNAADLPLPVNFLPYQPFDNGEMTVRDEGTLKWPRTRKDVTGKLARFYASITWTDAQIGRIVQTLEETGQLDNTVIIFAGDNGLSLGEHGLLGKQNLYENGGMHVPLLFCGPGVKPGRTDALAYLYDVFPTVCDLAGLGAPPGVNGHSLVPAMEGKAVNEYVLTAYKDVQRAVRNERWKLIRYPQIDKTQLFDLQADPHEMSDLAEKPEFAGQLSEMMPLLKRAQKEHGDACALTVAQPKPAAWEPPVDKRNSKR